MFACFRNALRHGLRLLAAFAVVACEGGEKPTPDAGVVVDPEPLLSLKPSPLYSAFVEGHEAKLPVVLRDATLRGMGAKFSSSDRSIADVTDTTEGALVTVKNEGKVVIRAVLGEDTGAAKLVITRYSEASWKLGEARYNAGARAISTPDGGVVSALALAEGPAARNPNGACTTCHSARADVLRIEDTPTQTAGYSDDELIRIITHGVRPEGAKSMLQTPSFLWGENHAWTATEEELHGLVAYVRTKEPKASTAIEGEGGIYVCPPTTGLPPLDGGLPPLCDRAGNVLPIPGRTGPSGVTTTPSNDAGVSRTMDASMPGDAG